MRKIKIPLIDFDLLIVVIILLALAALVGCKDKAEAKAKHIKGQIVWLDKLYIFNGQDYVPVMKETTEPDEPAYQAIYDRALSAEEIAEIDRKISEPNEPMGLLEWDGQKECWVGLEYPAKMILDIGSLIPTWPDYIELEKELIIGHTKFTNPNGSIGDAYGIVLEKGTKIYFKE